MITVDQMLQLRPKPITYSKKKHEDLINPRTAVQEKLDGWRMTIMRTDEIHIIGRKRYINYWDFIKHDLVLADRILDLPPNTVLDGEYHGEDNTGTDVPTLMRERSGNFTPWAIPWLDGECIASRSLPHANVVLMDLGWDPVDIAPMGPFTVEYLRRDAERSGLEGYVLKTSQWDLGSWFKVKPTRTFDLVVSSVVCGGVRGAIKSLCVSTREGVEIGKVGGLTDELRTRNDLIGKIAEVRAQGVTKNGKLKFVRLIRFRYDKDIPDSIGDI